jgi:hypothetical protein
MGSAGPEDLDAKTMRELHDLRSLQRILCTPHKSKRTDSFNSSHNPAECSNHEHEAYYPDDSTSGRSTFRKPSREYYNSSKYQQESPKMNPSPSWSHRRGFFGDLKFHSTPNVLCRLSSNASTWMSRRHNSDPEDFMSLRSASVVSSKHHAEEGRKPVHSLLSVLQTSIHASLSCPAAASTDASRLPKTQDYAHINKVSKYTVLHRNIT